MQILYSYSKFYIIEHYNLIVRMYFWQIGGPLFKQTSRNK